MVTNEEWRREWDSNPRYSLKYTRFPSVRLKPLGHLSRGRSTFSNLPYSPGEGAATPLANARAAIGAGCGAGGGRSGQSDQVGNLQRADYDHDGLVPSRQVENHGRASNTRLKGVSAARRKRLKPADVTTLRMRSSPACAPSAAPTSWAIEAGVQIIVEAE